MKRTASVPAFVSVLAFVSMLAMILAGCGSSPSASQPGSPVTLSFWIFDNAPMVKETQTLIKQYEQSHSNIHVNLQVLPNATYSQKYTVALSTNTAPDLLLIADRSMPQLVQNNALAPITPSSFGFSSEAALQQDWLSGSLAGLTFNNQAYGIPMEFDTFNLFINTQEFQQAGLDPQTQYPRTWDQLIQDAQKLTIYKNGALTQAGFAFPLFTGGWEKLVIDPMVRQLGGQLVTNGTTTHFTSPQAQQVFQTWSDIYNKYHIMQPGFSAMSATNPNQGFADGQVAMWLSGPWAVPTITQGDAAYGHYTVVPMPQYDPTHPVQLLYSWNWSVTHQSQHQAEAWSLINFLSAHQADWLSTCGYIQPRTGWLGQPVAKNFPNISTWIAGMQAGQYTFRSAKAAQVDDIIGSAVSSILEQHTPVNQALQQAQTTAQNQLGS